MTFLPRDVNKPFAFHMVISPTDSYMLAVQMRFIVHITSALKTHIINEMSCYAALCHVMSCDVTLHYVRSQSSCVLVIQSLRLKHSPPSSQGRWSSMGDI